ncbi:MAG: GntR family transcriptional regulator [Lachnospiraceae bacterium]|nr:GntR family transcriptional regulator [Lachnospiraceae bacterium]
MAWKIDNDRPVYLQLMEHIKKQIASGEYKAGDRVPPVRTLANDAGVNPNTMQKALQGLEREGLMYSNRTEGRFIADNSEIVDQLSTSSARQLTALYYENMKGLGMDDEDIITNLKEYIDETRG